MIRGSVRTGRKIIQQVVTYGNPPWRRCECGKWQDVETGEHVELVEMTWSEMMEKYEPKCPDGGKKEEK